METIPISSFDSLANQIDGQVCVPGKSSQQLENG